MVRELLNSGPDGGACPADYSLPCRGFTGECGDIASQFSSVPVLPDYPNGLADWTCHAFPDDDKPLDSFLVGLIAVACAIPVTWFMQSCFEIANDSEAPEVRSRGSCIPCMRAALMCRAFACAELAGVGRLAEVCLRPARAPAVALHARQAAAALRALVRAQQRRADNGDAREPVALLLRVRHAHGAVLGGRGARGEGGGRGGGAREGTRA